MCCLLQYTSRAAQLYRQLLERDVAKTIAASKDAGSTPVLPPAAEASSSTTVANGAAADSTGSNTNGNTLGITTPSGPVSDTSSAPASPTASSASAAAPGTVTAHLGSQDITLAHGPPRHECRYCQAAVRHCQLEGWHGAQCLDGCPQPVCVHDDSFLADAAAISCHGADIVSACLHVTCGLLTNHG